MSHRDARRFSRQRGKKRQTRRTSLLERLESRLALAVDWRNPLDSLDVDADGFVVPQDVLAIINEINSNGSRRLDDARPTAKPYFDATGDQFIAPQDALVIINYLNSEGAGRRVLHESSLLSDDNSITISVGQTAGSRSYQVQLETSFDKTDTTAALEDVLAVYVVDADHPTQTLLDRGVPGTAVFTLAGSKAEFQPGIATWDGSILSIDTTGLSPRTTARLVFQLLNSDADRGSTVTIRPVSNAVNPDGAIGSNWAAGSSTQSPGPAVNLSSLTTASAISLQVENVRFDSSTGRYSAELRATNSGAAVGRDVVVVLPGLPFGVSVRGASGTTANGAPYVNLRSVIPEGGLGTGERSEPLLLEIDDPNQLAFALRPQLLASSNRAPTLPPLAPLTVFPGGYLRVPLGATDADGDRLTYSLTSTTTLPTGELTADGALVFRPAPSELGTYEFDVSASDGAATTTRHATLAVVADPITTTRVSGKVLQVSGQPLAGMRVEVGPLQTLTGADGSFTLDLGAGPVVTDTLKVRGDLYPGSLAYPYIAEKLPLMLEHDLFAGVNNVISRSIYLPALDIANGKTINPAQNATVTTAAIPDVSLFVAAGTLMNQQGTPFTGTLSITRVPTDLTPAALPENLSPDLVVTIQPGDMVFASPAPLTLPNTANWPAGTLLDLWSINPVTGQFDDVGDMRVSTDGKTIQTISGGVRNSSWHFAAPPAPIPLPIDLPESDCDDCEDEADFSSKVEFNSGAVVETHDMVAYMSQGVKRQWTLKYDSLRADPRPILHLGFSNTPADPNARFVANVAIERGTFSQQIPGFAGGYGLDAGAHIWRLPAAGGTIDAPLQLDMTTQPSGVYSAQVTEGLFQFNGTTYSGATIEQSVVIIHVNSRQSAFGAGWGLSGLQQLVENPDGSALIIDGDGSQLLFRKATGNGGGYVTPDGNFSNLARRPSGGWTLTTPDQTVSTFDRGGKLVSIIDRNHNSTTFDYDVAGRLIRVTDPVGLQTNFAIGGDGRVASITDPAGRVTQLSYDASGNLVRVTNPDGAERAWSYDARHLLVGEVNERGDRETTEYDFAGRATRATQADGSVRQIQPRQTQNLLPPSATINPLSPPVAASIWSPQVRFSDPIGNVLTSQLDSDGQRVAARDPAGPLPGFERNRQNLVRQASDGRGNLTLFTYDSRGNLVSVQDSLIATASTGEVLGSITEPGETDVYVFDAVAGTVGFYDSLDNDRDGVAVQLYTPSGQAMLPYSFFNSGQPDRDRGPARLPETGTYRLEIGGTGATGDYRFRLLDFADASTLTLSTPVTGRLDTDLAAQLYRFTGTAGQHLRFDSNSTGAAIAACDWRFTDVGTGEFGFDAGGSLDQDFDTSLPAAGDYALIVSCPADTATGSPLDFQFTVQQLTDPATPASGFDIVHSGTIAAGQTVDYSFSAPAGTLIYVDSLSGTYAPLIGQIFDSTGQLITNTDVTRDAIANVADGLFTLPKSDTFTLRVSGITASNTGEYSFRLRNASTAAVAALGAAISGTLDPDTQTAIYGMRDAAAARLYVDSLGSDRPIDVVVMSPSGDFMPVNVESVFSLDSAAKHYLVANDYYADGTASPTNFQFRVLPIANATPITLGVDFTGSLPATGEDSLFRITGQAGQRLFFDSLGSDSRARWRLFSPDNRLISDQYQSAENDFAVDLPSDGEYVLALVNQSTDQADFHFRVYTPSTTTAAMTLGRVIDGTIAVPGDRHAYTFTGAAGQQLLLDHRAAGPANSLPIKVRLTSQRDSTGYEGSALPTDEPAPITLAASGEYTLEFGGGDATGDYSFRLLDLSAAPSLDVGTPLDGTLEPGWETDVVRFVASAGKRIRFDSQADSTDVTWTMYGPSDSRQVALVSMGESFETTFAADGVYSLVVTGARSEPIAYQLSAVDISDAPTTPSGFDQLYYGNIGVGGETVLSLTGAAGQLGYFDSQSPNAELTYTLTAPDGSTVLYDGVAFDSSRFVLPRSGNHTLTITNDSGSPQGYRFRLIELGAQLNAIVPGQDVQGGFAPGTETDFYRMSGAAGQLMYFDWRADTSDATSEFVLVSPAGVATEINLTQPFIQLHETGDYYIGVRQPFGGPIRDYVFRVIDLANSTTVAPPTSIQETLPAYAASTYTFTAVADALAYLSFTESPFDRLNAILVNGAGQIVAVNQFLTTTKLPADDTYYLVLDNLLSSDVGFDLRFNVALPTIANLRAEQGDSQPVTYTYDANFSQLSSITDALGRKTLYEIDPLNGNRLSSTQVVGLVGGDDDLVVRYTYTAHGMVDTLTDALGRVTDYDYDALDRLIRVTSAKGTAVEAIESSEYDAAGNVAAYVDALGRRTTYVYDAANRLLRTTQPDPDGAGPLAAPIWQSTYDAAGNQRTITDPIGRVTSFEYDRAGRVVKTTDAAGQVATYEYDPAGNLVAQVDRLGRRSTFEYDGRGRVVAVVDPLNKRTKYAYDTDGNLISETDPLGHTTSYTYDGRSRVTSRTDALGGIQRWRYDLADNIVQTTDEAGRTTLLRYDDLNRQVAKIDPLAGTISYRYDKAGNILSLTDELGHTSSNTYDALNRLATSVDTLGGVWTTGYDAVGNVTSLIDAAGHETRLTYDALDRRTSRVDALNGVTSWSYDAVGNLLTSTDALNRATSFGYDALNRLTLATDALGGRWTTVYDAEDNITSSTNPLSQTTNYSYDARNRPTQITAADPDGADGPAASPVTRFTYDAVDNLTSSIDPLGRTTTFTYDAVSRLTRTTDAAGGQTDYTYDAVGLPISISDPLHRTTTFTYDALRRRTRVTDAAGQATDFSYDAAGNLVRQVDALGRTTHYEFDAAGRPTATVDPAGGRSSIAYDAVGNVTSSTDALQQVTQFTYDALHRLIRTTDPLGNSVERTYDAVGNPTSVSDALHHATSYTFDALNRVTQITDPQGGVTRYERDALGNVTKFTDANSNATRYTFDALNRVVAETNPLNATRTMAYDAASNVVRATDRNGRARQFTYDALNRLQREQWLDGGNSVVRTFDWSFDAASQLTAAQDADSKYAFTYDVVGRVASHTNSGTPGAPTVEFSSTYDAVGNRTSVTDKAAGQTLGTTSFTYDTRDLLTQVSRSGARSSNQRVELRYDAAGRPASVERFTALTGGSPVATSTYAYDAANHLTSLTHTRAASTLANYGFTYDAADRLLQATSPDGIATYSYDQRDQLVSADYSSPQLDETYSYDAEGNRTTAGNQTGAANRLLSDGTYQYTYDAEGNRTRRAEIATGATTDYSWDYRNRLTSIVDKTAGGTVVRRADYTYDIFNRRIAKSVDADGAGPQSPTVTRFAYDGDDLTVQFDGSGNVTHQYLHGPAVDQVLADDRGAGGVIWTLEDQLGTARDLVDASGAIVNHRTFDSFGRVVSETNAAVDYLFGFTGRERDAESGLNYYRNRYYDPRTGRFLSEDPLGLAGGDGNLTRYVGNHPTGAVDPFGLQESPSTPQYLPPMEGILAAIPELAGPNQWGPSQAGPNSAGPLQGHLESTGDGTGPTPSDGGSTAPTKLTGGIEERVPFTPPSAETPSLAPDPLPPAPPQKYVPGEPLKGETHVDNYRPDFHGTKQTPKLDPAGEKHGDGKATGDKPLKGKLDDGGQRAPKKKAPTKGACRPKDEKPKTPTEVDPPVPPIPPLIKPPHRSKQEPFDAIDCDKLAKAIKLMRQILRDELMYGTQEAATRHTNTFPSIQEGFKDYIANYGMPSKHGRIDVDWMMTMIQFGADKSNIRSTYVASKSIWWPASFINQVWGGKEQGTKHVPFNDANETRMILLIESGKVRHFSDLWDERFLQDLEQRLKKECCCKQGK